MDMSFSILIPTQRWTIWVIPNVLKTEPDRPVRPVEPSTSELSSSVQLNEPFYGQTGIELFKPPVEPPNWTNCPVFYEPAKLFFFPILQIFVTIKRPINEPNSLPNTFKTYKPIFGSSH